MNHREQILANLAQYVNLSENEAGYFLSLLKMRRYKKKQYLVQTYDKTEFDFFLVEGLVKEYITDFEGKDYIIQFVKENEWTTDYDSFLTGKEAKLNIQAIEDVVTYAVNFADLQLLMKTYPIFEKCYRVFFQQAYTSLQLRLVDYHAKTAEQRYIEFLENEFELSQRLPQHQIASYLGVSAEFLSKIRQKIASK